MLKIQITLLVIIFFGVIGWLYWQCKLKSTDLSIINLNKKDYKYMIILTLLFGGLSLVNFADRLDYSNSWQGNSSGEELEINFSHPTKISKLYYRTAYLKGNYTISVFDDKNQLLNIDDKSSHLGYLPYFRWNNVAIESTVNIAKIIFKVNQPVVQFKQFAILDASGKIFSNYIVTTNNDQKSVLTSMASVDLPPHIEQTWQSSSVFDEIFYATSAYQYLHGIAPDVWVHPQLGILAIAMGMKVFGETPFAWRIMPDLISIFMISLIYIFAKAVTNDTRASIIASLLMGVEFMHYTMGRTASIDPFVTFFLLAEYFFLYCYFEGRIFKKSSFMANLNYLVAASIFFGLGISSKWSALYSAPFILVILILGELIFNRSNIRELIKIIASLFLIFIILPLIIYLISYIPYAFITGSSNLFEMTLRLQQGMLDFNLHSLTYATHPYASKWWSWPLVKTPMSIYFWMDEHTQQSISVALLGNPLIYWAFVIVFINLLLRVFDTSRDYNALFLALIICFQYLPYAFVARISFIYYFYSVAPFLILGIAYCCNILFSYKNKLYNYGVWFYVTLCIITFVIFFSALAGLEVPRWYTTNFLWWVKGWDF